MLAPTLPRTAPPGRLDTGLDAAQRAAVLHGVSDGRIGPACPPLLIVAGAGTGKTLTLASRVAQLILAGADPQRLLLVSFSRRAAAELARRSGRLLHAALGLPPTTEPPRLPWAGTFHGIAARLLRQHGPAIGLPTDFDVIDRSDAEELMGQVRLGLALQRSETRFPTAATCLAIHSRVVNSGEPLRELLARAWPWCDVHHDGLTQLFEAYAREKRRQHLLDLDDLLLQWRTLLDAAPVAAALRARFDHVLVDEYQDTNPLQAAIVLRMRPGGHGLVVVGDDAQAIYAFRGASVRGMLEFEAAFEPPATRVTLTHNHRSTPQILALANAVMAEASVGFAKTLTSRRPPSLKPRLVAVADEAAQAAWVADEVLAQRENGLALKRQAVLFRTSHHSATLEFELARRRIPYVKYGGLRFFESAHVKDLLAVLRWAQTPRARLAGQRVLRLVPGIGAIGAQALLDALDASPDPAAAREHWQPAARAEAEWLALRRTLATPWPAGLEAARVWYTPHLRRLHDDAATREADLQHLLRIGASYTSAERFLTELALDPPAASSDEAADPLLDEDYLILSTIHSAKGQEWSVVNVLNLVDGCMPADMATGSVEELEEERRLLYVAITRAKDELNLLAPQRFYVTQQRRFGDRHLYAVPSRFLGDAAMACVETPAPQEPG